MPSELASPRSGRPRASDLRPVVTPAATDPFGSEVGSGGRSRRTPTGLLAIFYAFSVVAVLGYGIFGLHPELLPTSSAFATWMYRGSFQWFAQIHIMLAGVALLATLALRVPVRRWAPALALIYAVSFLSEFLGTGYGIPFGDYGYSGLLGYKLGGRVPWLIPLSWFLMAVPSYVVACRRFPTASAWPGRMALATGLLVAWDLALDPAMSFLTPYWQWGETGRYYGMPAVNLVGWAGTGVLLMAILELLRARDWLPRLGVRYSVGMIVAAGLWLGVAVTTVAVGLLLALGLAPAPRGHGVAGSAPPRAPSRAVGGGGG